MSNDDNNHVRGDFHHTMVQSTREEFFEFMRKKIDNHEKNDEIVSIFVIAMMRPEETEMADGRTQLAQAVDVMHNFQTDDEAYYVVGTACNNILHAMENNRRRQKAN